jgi:hypothetical protein
LSVVGKFARNYLNFKLGNKNVSKNIPKKMFLQIIEEKEEVGKKINSLLFFVEW